MIFLLLLGCAPGLLFIAFTPWHDIVIIYVFFLRQRSTAAACVHKSGRSQAKQPPRSTPAKVQRVIVPFLMSVVISLSRITDINGEIHDAEN